MKVLAYIPVHYGSDYIRYAIQSVYPCVDEILILYTAKPSHGSGTSMTNPDTKENIMIEINNADPKGIVKMIEGTWTREGLHRDVAFDYAKINGYDIVVALDTDEVWETKYLKELIQLTYEKKASKCLVWMRHLWRSFNYICDDPMRQERVSYIGNDKTELIYAPQPVNQVWHFGYARSFKDVEYKISIHGHSGEWLTTKEKWFNEKYKPFPPVNEVHPTCTGIWNPVYFDRNYLPEIMKAHPWFNLEEIK